MKKSVDVVCANLGIFRAPLSEVVAGVVVVVTGLKVKMGDDAAAGFSTVDTSFDGLEDEPFFHLTIESAKGFGASSDDESLLLLSKTLEFVVGGCDNSEDG